MKARHAQRGASLPETAITMAVVLALLFGVIDFGRALYTYTFVATIAREGARWAIVRGSNCTLLDHCNASATEVTAYVQSLSEGATDPSQIALNSNMWPGTGCPSSATTNNAPGCLVVVQVSYPFTFMLPFLPKATIQMQSTSQMVISL